MRVGAANTSPELMAAECDVAIQKKGQEQMKQEGEAVVKMIDNAGVNRPLPEGPVGRKINIAM